jgi:hypothetical protein
MIEEYGRLAESTNRECLKKQCQGIVDLFEDEWLRLPRDDELLRLSREYASMGLPGCWGAVDCASWFWGACPTAWAGQYRGKGKKTNIRVEVVCDDFLHFWWCNFGSPGAGNDKQIINQSQRFNSIRTGQWPKTTTDIDIDGYKLTWLYLLCDGIYPRFRYLMSSCLSPTLPMKIFFSERQDGARKAVERLFGVLFKKWATFYRPSRLWHVEDMEIIMKACTILHSMSCDERRETFTGSSAAQMTLDSNQLEEADDIPIILPPDALEDPGEASAFWRSHPSGVEDPTQHLELKEALQKNMWIRRK